MGCDDYPTITGEIVLTQPDPTPLVALGPFDHVKAAIEKAESVKELKDIRDRAVAASAYMKAARLTKPVADECAEIRLRAERRAGEILRDDPRIRPNSNELLLIDLELSRIQSSRWQKISDPPDYVFEDYLLEAKADDKADISASGLALFWGRQREPQPVDRIPPRDGTYSCIVIDPPWPMHKIERDLYPDQGYGLDYSTLTIQELADDDLVPVRTHAADDCHLYLWVTHKFLPAGLQLMADWGFRYQCVMTWRKNVGFTPFSWMYDTEHVLFGTRGNLPLLQNGLRLSFDAPRTKHSEKPDIFYDRVIAASPGPRIDMFARTQRDGFDVWGNEVTDAII